MGQKKVADKIKPLMPSLREKKRYISFEVIAKNPIDFQLISDSVYSSLRELYGTAGESEAGVIMIKKMYDKKTNRGIIRVNNKYLDKLRLTLAMIDKIDDEKVIVKSITASGMIKKAREAIAI